jgi:hypothetical protein
LTPYALRRSALRHARFNVGVAERGANNRGPKVDEIIEYAHGALGEPWCVDFVIWCYGHSGSSVVRPGFTRAVRFMALRRSVIETVSQPHSGNIVRYTFDHTGLFWHACNVRGQRRPWRLATHVKTVEGNTDGTGTVSDGQRDGVHVCVRSKLLVRDYLRVLR